MAAAIGRNEAWVTFARDDKDAKRALVLLKSLRRTCTNRKVILIMSPDISQHLWKPLKSNFDGLYPLALSLGGSTTNFQVDCTIFAMTLVAYRKLVLLSPSAMVLENCDELFKLEGFVIGKKETGFMILEPDCEHHWNIFSSMIQKQNEESDSFCKLVKVFQKLHNATFLLDDAFDFVVDSKTVKLSQEELLVKNVKIVHFQNVESLLTHNGHLAMFYKTVWQLEKQFAQEVEEYMKCSDQLNTTFKGYENEPIAIVGMSCRMPACKSVEEYWKLLVEGRCAISDPPEGRWTKEQNCFIGPQHKGVQAGFLSVPIDYFDAKFFGISPFEAEVIDPQQRLLLELAWEAFEEAGINPQTLHGSHTGVFSGAWTLLYRDSYLQDTGFDAKDNFRAYMGNCYGTLGGRIAHCLDLTGPNIGTESGCSSSSVAVGLAIQSLRRGEVNLALACGVNILTTPFTLQDFPGILSPENRCKVFSKDANGFVRSEGCGVLVMKRLSDAVKDGDQVHALIRGFGMSQEGMSRSMGTPTVDGEAFALKLALEDAHISPKEVQLVELHGTGTAIGDPLEIKAIAKVYATSEREVPLILTGGKANIGHTESCSGISGIIKTILEMREQTIPPQICIDTLNPLIELDKIPAEIALTAKVWESKGPRIAGISSFGITGTDTHVILQEIPHSQSFNRDWKFGALPSPPQNLLTFSAKSKQALEEMVENYKTFFADNKDASLDSVVFSANTGRAIFPHRVSVWGKNSQEVADKLAKGLYDVGIVEESNEKPKICFLFTGQGSQFHGMGKVLYETSPIFKLNFDKCEQILKLLYGLELKGALWGEDTSKLHQSLYSQSAIFVMEYCLVKLWESWGITPTCVVGHSLGEFAAATTAGILSVEDALKLLGARCRLIDSLPKGSMIAVKANEQKASGYVASFLAACGSSKKDYWVDVAAANSPDQTTLSGHENVIEEFKKFCEIHDIKTHLLDATHAFHSRAMNPILVKYEKVARSISYKQAKIQFISGVEGKSLEEVDAQYWVRHTRDTVQFCKAASVCLHQEQIPLFLEIGPHPVLSALIHANAPNTVQNLKCFPSIRKPPNNGAPTESTEWQTMLDTLGKLHLAGVSINFQEFHRFHAKSKVQLPFYPFQRKRYWVSFRNYIVSKRNFHPLLGFKVDSPKTTEHDFAGSAKQTRFQNTVAVSTHGYIGDHKLGKFVLMPGAGFIEIFLAAASTQAIQEFPIILENILIKVPLVVEDVVPKEVHTVLTLIGDDHQDTGKITVFGRPADTKWAVHAECTANFEITEEINVESLASVKDRICTEQSTNQDIYKQMAALGYNFGKLFQTLSTVWVKGKECLFQIGFATELHDERDMCHPVLIDSMVQALLLSSSEKLNGLYLPIGVKRFVLLNTSFKRKNEAEEKQQELNFFLHVKLISESVESNQMAVLYSSEGTPIAIMSGVEGVKTSLIALEIRLEAGKKEHALPALYQEDWRRCSDGFTTAQYESPFLLEIKDEIQANVDSKPTDMEGDDDSFKAIEDNAVVGIILSLLKLGMNLGPVGSTFDALELVKDLNIAKELIKPFLRYLDIVAEEGYFEPCDERQNILKVKKLFPSKEELLRARVKFVSEETVVFQTNLEKPYNQFYLDKLSNFLSGKESALTYLFPEGEIVEGTYSATRIYAYSQISKRNYTVLEAMLPCLFAQCLQRKKSADGKAVGIKILEIGAGLGSATKIALQALTDSDIKFSYTYTDISNAFFVKARETFEPHLKNMEFKVLNVEEDPKAQGFAPNQFDIVIAANVLHSTRDLTETCRNIRHLMKNYGLILVAETFSPQRMIDVAFGILPGYFRQTDVELRPRHCLVDGQSWSQVLNSTGFTEGSLIFPTNGGRTGVVVAEASGKFEQYVPPITQKVKKVPQTWLVFGDSSTFSKTAKKSIISHGKSVVFIENSNAFEALIGRCYKIQGNSHEDFETLWDSLRTQSIFEDVEGILYLWGSNSSSAEKCMEMTTFYTEAFLYLVQTMWNEWPNKIPHLIVVTRGLFFVNDQNPICPAHSTTLGIFRTFMSENRNLFGKFIDLSGDEDNPDFDMEQIASELWLADTKHILAYRNGTRYTMKFIPTSKHVGLPYPSLDLDITYTTKRFHIVLPASHSISDLKFETHNIKPTLEPFEVEVEVKASALNFRDILSVLKPTPQFDNVNAIGVDICGTVVAVGDKVSKRKVGDQIIACNYKNVAMPSHIAIHENSAVLLPPSMTFAEGATLPTVFVTAYHCLVTVGQLKATDTILIHTTSGGVGLCALQIARNIGTTVIATAGSKRKRAYLKFLGVQHIFNSRDLTFGEGVMKATKGRGVDLVLNSLTGPGFKETSLKCLAQNGKFVEMSKLNIWSVEQVHEMRPDVKYSIEDLSSADEERMIFLLEEMDRYLNHKQHPLKPLPYTLFQVTDIRSALTYLEKAKQIGKVVCVLPTTPRKDSNSVEIQLFNDRSTYLITGGCGGIGFEVMKWMCENGAKTIIIWGRRCPSTENMKQVDALNQKGKSVIVVQGDVGDIKRCEEIITWIKEELPPLRGIMHAAGCLSDAVIMNQSMEKFEVTFNPKVRGGWNLHKLTLDCALEHFVMFSSAVAEFGNQGQSNHAAANTFLDALVSYRRQMGLVGLTVNWGQWGDVGVAAGMDLGFIYPITNHEGLNALAASLRGNAMQVAAADFDVTTFLRLVPWHHSLLELLTIKGTDGNKMECVSSEAFWKDMNEAEGDGEKITVVKTYLTNIVTKMLRLDETVEPDQNFQDLGMDSLMMIELKNQVQIMLGPDTTVTANEMADCKTVRLTAQKIMEMISSNGSDPLISRNNLITEDSVLWNTIDITDSLPYVPIDQVEVVLMTGCTGTLGPYLLQELSTYPQLTKVICLLRPVHSQTAMDRLKKRLEYLNLLEKTDMSKISVIEGDVTQDLFGIDETLYEKLALEVQAVISCAVHTSHLEMYGRGASKHSGIKAVNVDGTQRTLQFASTKLVKHVYHGSTILGAFYNPDMVATAEIRSGFPAHWPLTGDADKAPSFGYAISKFISDSLVGKAVQRGLPCKCFRFPKIVGEKDTGRQETQENHFFLKFVYFLQSGVMPSTEIPLQVVPVDTCAQLSLKIFFHPDAPFEIFSMLNPHHQLETDLKYLTHEYGPLFRITENLWRVADEIEELKQISETDEAKLMPRFFEILNKYCQQENIDLEPMMGLIMEFDAKSVIANPSIIFRNPKVKEYLKENYGYPMRIVPYGEFVKQLLKDGEKTKLYKWVEWYTGDDAPYKMLEKHDTEEYDRFKLKSSEVLDASCEKVARLIPNLKEIIEDGLQIVRKDFDYAIDHAVETFRRSEKVIEKYL